MSEPCHLLIFGASVRAAAFSALRAGMQPWCSDLFADLDLRAQCACVQVPTEHYPERFRDVIDLGPRGPWIYTGALENHPKLLDDLEKKRPLWGVPGWRMSQLRCPFELAAGYRRRGLLHPSAVHPADSHPPSLSRKLVSRLTLLRALGPHRPHPAEGWLIKSRYSAGGSRIRFWKGERLRSNGPLYLQRYVEGTPLAALFVGSSEGARLLGVTRQLVGEPWLHAAPFHYCGSLGPLQLTDDLRQRIQQVGEAILELNAPGLFGIDLVCQRDIPFPIEVNPRYTASVEVLEYATGLAALTHHRRVFDPTAPEPAEPLAPSSTVVGKAILFAREPLVFPADGPWRATLDHPRPVSEMPDFADISAPGTPMDTGQPILTFFSRGSSVAACEEQLRHIAADLDRWLYRR